MEKDLHKLIKHAPKIGVFGSDGGHCSPEAEAMAEEVGRLLARRGAVVFTGGKDGVMEAASRGASREGGLVVAVLPDGEVSAANRYASLVLATGMGFARGQILTNSVDGAILVEGGIGTLGEAAMMYLLKKPVAALCPSGGVAAELAGKVLDRRGLAPVLEARSAEEAVDLVLRERGGA